MFTFVEIYTFDFYLKIYHKKIDLHIVQKFMETHVN
jgi:hypothetical protein